MADKIRGITIEISGDTSKLTASLSSTNKEIKDTQKELKDVERLLKLDPTNINLLRQRQQLLNQAVDETRKKLETLKELQSKMDAEGIDKNSEQYRALQREIASTEASLKKLETQAASSNATMAQIGAVADQIAKKTGELAEKTRGLSVAGAGLVTAIGGLAYSAAKGADELNTLAQQTGFSVEELQKFQYASDRVDVSMNDITSAAQRLKRNMGSGSDSVTSTFERLGVAVRDSNGNLRNSTDVFYDVVKALGNVEDGTERDILAMTLLGKNADTLAGIIDDGGAALKRMGDEAQAAGLIMDRKTVNSLNDVNDQIDELKARIKLALAQGGAKAIEAAIPLIETAASVINTVVEKLGELDENQIKTIATLGLVAAAVSPVLKLISGVASGVSSLMTILPGLISLIAANPFGAAVIALGGITAGIVALSNITKETKDYVKELTPAVEDLKKEADALKATYDSQTKTYDLNYAAAKKILDRMRELESQGVKLGDKQGEYNQLVADLNALYPDLNAQVNEYTGKVEGGTTAISNQIDELHKLYIEQAMQSYYTSMLEKYSAVQIEVWKNEALLTEAKAKATAAEDAYNAAKARTEEVMAREAEALAAGSEAWNAWVAERDAAKDAENEAKLAFDQATANVDSLTAAVVRGKQAMAGYDAQIDETRRAVEAGMANMYSDGYDGGANFGQGLIDGLLAKRKRANEAAYALADGIKKVSYTTLEENSPSKVAQEMGEYWGEGMAIGIENSRKAVLDAAQTITQPMTQPLPSVTNNTTSNLGGVYVTVNAAQGQDAEQIAQAVMFEIQAAVEREGAAL